MTEAEKRVIKAARYVVELWRKKWLGESGHGDSRRALIDTVDALLAERASPPPAPAVDVAGLEREVTEAAISVADKDAKVRSISRGSGGWLQAWDELGGAQRRFDAARKALADARKPKALLTVDEALAAYEAAYFGRDDPRGRRWTAEHRAALSAVLAADRERFVAAVEAMPVHEVEVANGDQEGVILCRAIEDIRALGRSA